jgi:putative drug exporter of the RND superfamily
VRVNPETLAKASSHHPWRTLMVWLAVLVTAGVSSGLFLSGGLTTKFDFTNNPEAKQAKTIVDNAFPGAKAITETWVVTTDGSVGDPAFTQTMNTLLSKINALGPSVVTAAPDSFPAASTTDPVQAALGPISAQDQKAVLFSVVLKGNDDQAAKNVDQFTAIRDSLTTDGVHVYTLGEVTSSADFKLVSQQDIEKGELIGIIVAIIVLVLVFGAAVAAVTPIIMGIFSIVVATGIVALIGQVWRFSFFVPELMTMMGLAVGIDYSLFIVSRYREERARGYEKLDAIGAAGATANRAVFFSGLTVVLALLGMLIIPTTIFRGLAGGAILVVLVAIAASMTLLPAVIALLGDRLNAGRIFHRKRPAVLPGREGGFWDLQTRRVMKYPVWFLVGGVTFMLLLATPYFFQKHADDSGRGIKTGISGLSTLPNGIQTKAAFDQVIAHFPKAGTDNPVQVVITGSPTKSEVDAAIAKLKTEIADDPAFGAVGAPQTSPDGSVVLVDVTLTGPATDPSSEAAVAAVGRMRETFVPDAFTGLKVLVGGQTAFNKDFFDITSNYTPYIFLFVLGLSFLLLTVVFRSIVLPVKAILMNLLSVGAAYGAIVLVFQKGGPAIGKAIADFLGFNQVDAIEAWLPLFLFSILFGLSMDYHVFLLTRIREEYDKSGDNAEAVAYGLRTTAGIITGAAVIMVAVFAGFAAGRLVSLQEMGFGLAVAVFLDATVIRSIVVPSSMRLLGTINWYLPKWLDWLPKVNVEGHEPDLAITVPDSPAELVDAKE